MSVGALRKSTPQRSTRTGPPYRIGDVIFVQRPPRGVITYCHAGIVTEIDDDGQMTEMVDFDPIFDGGAYRRHPNLLRDVTIGSGVTGVPRTLRGLGTIQRVFWDGHTHIEHDGPEDDDGIVAVMARIMDAMSRQRVYKLYSNNCQHFVTEMRYGEGFSRDALEMPVRLTEAAAYAGARAASRAGRAAYAVGSRVVSSAYSGASRAYNSFTTSRVVADPLPVATSTPLLDSAEVLASPLLASPTAGSPGFTGGADPAFATPAFPPPAYDARPSTRGPVLVSPTGHASTLPAFGRPGYDTLPRPATTPAPYLLSRSSVPARASQPRPSASFSFRS